MIGEYQQRCAARVDAALAELFEAPREELARLYQAMRYSFMNGGKRVRPLLVYAACETLEGDLERGRGALPRPHQRHHLMARDHRQPRRRQFVVDQVQISAAHAACRDAQQQLARTRLRDIDPLQFQRPAPPRPDHGTHAYSVADRPERGESAECAGRPWHPSGCRRLTRRSP